MQNLWNIYHHDIPSFLLEFMETTEMQRLKDIGMNCGVEYTNFPVFKKSMPYSRFDHSVGVALIVWHFTGDIKQSVAGLLHDIATPVFAHTIDFLNNDHLKQESTEIETENMITKSYALTKLLKKYELTIQDVCDYHIYPLADNEMPRLSADRLEYSLGNMYHYGFVQIGEIKKYYHHIYVNNRKEELAFDDWQTAIAFTKDVFKTSRVYISDEDRFAMQSLAFMLKSALNDGIIKQQDLYTTETEVIRKLQANMQYSLWWKNYCRYCQVIRSDEPVFQAIRIPAKKRYIIPLYHDKRIDSLSQEIAQLKVDFLKISFDYFVYSK